MADVRTLYLKEAKAKMKNRSAKADRTGATMAYVNPISTLTTQTDRPTM